MTPRSEPLSRSFAHERVLVVGGRGFVGSHIVRALAAAGVRPQVFGPPMVEDLLADLGGLFDEYEGSIDSRDSLRDALRASQARFVISCAAHGVGRLGLMRAGEADADAAMNINVTGLHKLLDCAREARVRRVVWTSSTVVYGPSENYTVQPVDELAAKAPTTFYGLTKTLAEDVAGYYARRHGMSVVGLRLPLVLGRGLWYAGVAAALAQLFESARAGKPCRFEFHDEEIDLMHVSDVAAAVVGVLRHAGRLDSVYNLAGFKARASDLIAEIRRQKPGTQIEMERIRPPMLFPLISGARLAHDVGLNPPMDLPAFTQAMLA
jgi:nucleoside-diphosphate-sugar epimerase